jgi:hypothetical protein
MPPLANLYAHAMPVFKPTAVYEKVAVAFPSPARRVVVIANAATLRQRMILRTRSLLTIDILRDVQAINVPLPRCGPTHGGDGFPSALSTESLDGLHRTNFSASTVLAETRSPSRNSLS